MAQLPANLLADLAALVQQERHGEPPHSPAPTVTPAPAREPSGSAATATGGVSETLPYPDRTTAAVRELASRGWSPLPLPASRKTPPPNGFTGADAPDATPAQIDAWVRTGAFGNVAVRVGDEEIGIDVDDYDGKGGAQTLVSAEDTFGSLPDGPRSGNRGVDDPSCVRWFRKPAGVKLHSPGKGIDLLQRHHRYAVVAPSLHPDGRRYEWFGTDGPDVPPRTSDLPELPVAWIEGLSSPTAAANVKGSRHDAMIARVYAKVGDGDEADLPKLRAEFIAAVAGDRRGGEQEAADEFDRAVNTAHEKRDFGTLKPKPVSDAERAAQGAMLLPDSFWSGRNSLRGIRDHAAAGMLCPDALLGAVLCRVISHVGPNVALPPLVGLTRASLNLIVALVGRSGAGKSVTQASASELAWSAAGPAVELGSGEGVAAAFYGTIHEDRPDREQPGKSKRVPVYKQTRHRRAFQATEVDGLNARMSRTGATLDSSLRSLWSGEDLEAAYSDKAKRHQVPAGSYRATVLVGVQPEHASPLLTGSAATSGLAQRVLWLSAEDPRIEIPDAGMPAPTWKWESPLSVSQAMQPALDEDGEPLDTPGLLHEVDVPASVKLELQQARLAATRGEHDPLEGHAGLTRLKVAAGLALLEGRLDLNEEDWQLAGQVLRTSRAVRDYCASKLARVTEQQAASRGRVDAMRENAADDHRLHTAAARLARHVRRHHDKGKPPCSGRCQKDAVGGSARRGLEHGEIREYAVERRWVVESAYTPSNPGAASHGDQVGLLPGPVEPPDRSE